MHLGPAQSSEGLVHEPPLGEDEPKLARLRLSPVHLKDEPPAHLFANLLEVSAAEVSFLRTRTCNMVARRYKCTHMKVTNSPC